VSPITGGSDTPAADGWRLVGRSGPGFSYEDDVAPSGRATGRFESDEHPGVRVVLTFLLDGTVLSFEVHNAGTKRAYSRSELALRADAVDRPLADVSIGSRFVRSIPIGDLVRVARAAVLKFTEDTAEGFTGEAAEQLAGHIRALRGDTRRPGRRGHDDRYYAQLAMAYEAWQTTPEKLEVRARQVHLTVSGLRAALHTARTKGFLTKAPPGRAGGMATDRAKELAGGIDR
jgi:hypothetical protein